MNANLKNRISSNLARAKTVHATLNAAMQTRIAHQDALIANGALTARSTEWARIDSFLNRDPEGTVRQIAACGRAFDVEQVAKRLHVCTQGDTYVAVKVAEKVCKFIDAVFSGNSARSTDYAVQVICNALDMGGSISINDALASLSRRVAPDSASLKSRGSYTPGTAGAQASQIRMLALYLGFADVSKGKRNDILKIKADRMPELCELFATVPRATEAITADEIDAMVADEVTSDAE